MMFKRRILTPIGCFFTLLFYLLPTVVMASPQRLTYQGRIVKLDGTPLEYNDVTFIFDITSPDGTCILYEEQKTHVDMSSSSGIFDISIGDGTVNFATGGGTNISDAFINGASLTCSDGSSWIAGTNSERLLKVRFHDGISYKEITPASTIRSVPFALSALNAQALGNKTANDFVLKSVLPAATCGAGEVLTWNGTALTCVTDTGGTGTISSITAGSGLTGGGSSGAVTLSMASSGVTAGSYGSATQVPVVTVDALGRVTGASVTTITGVTPGGPATGDLSGSYPNPTVTKLQGISVSATVPTTDGQVLRFDGSAWKPNFIAMTDLRSSVTGTNQFANACSASQTLTYDSVSDLMSCTNIAVSGSNFSNQTQNTFLAAPTGSTGAPTFRTIASVDLPKTGANGVYVNGGNSFGTTATLGTLDANSVNVVTNGTTQLSIASGGNVAIGSGSPSATAKLQVSGAIVTPPSTIASGGAVDLSISNTITLSSVGSSTITLSNMVHGGTYTIVVADTTSRQYTFSGCNSSKFSPPNMATTNGTPSIYAILTVYNGTTYDCYITWSTGFQ